MASGGTLAALQRRVLQRCNLEGMSARELITNQELTDYINIGVAKWYDEVRGTTWNGAYYRSSYAFQTSAIAGPPNSNPPANAVYPLPSDFLNATSVDCFVSPSVVISARAFQEEERNMYRYFLGAIGWFLGSVVYYQIQGQGNAGTPYIVLMPPPQSQFNVQVNYVPTCPVLSLPDDFIDDINGWSEFIVLDASILCLMKIGRQEEIPIYAARLEQERGRIKKMAPRRDQSQAERVHELNRDDDGWMY